MNESRRLLSTRRRVPAALLDDYHAAWELLAGIARTAGINAWRFRSVTDPDLFMEFLESKTGDPREAGSVEETLMRVGDLLPGDTEEWIADY